VVTLLYQKRNGFLLFLSKKVPQKRTLCEHFWDSLFFHAGKAARSGSLSKSSFWITGCRPKYPDSFWRSRANPVASKIPFALPFIKSVQNRQKLLAGRAAQKRPAIRPFRASRPCRGYIARVRLSVSFRECYPCRDFAGGAAGNAGIRPCARMDLPE